MEHAKQGAVALAANDAAKAVDEYTKALIEHPTSPDYFTQRSVALTRIKPPRYDLALHDAEYGILCGQKRGKRDKIQAAQQRRVVCLYQLERYADALLVLDSMLRWRPKAPNSQEITNPQKMEDNIWRSKITKKLETVPQEATIAEYPELTLADEKVMKKLLEKRLKKDGTFNYDGEEQEVEMADAGEKGKATMTDPVVPTTNTTTSTPAPAPAPATTAQPQKIRHEWYQNNQSVIITLYAKGVQKDKIEVDMEADSLSISFPHPSDLSTSYSYTLDPLFDFIEPQSSKYQVMSTKVEITLAKAVPGQKWPTIEGSAPLKKADNLLAQEDPVKAAVLSDVQQQSTAQAASAPSYPTSSKHGVKNWDKLADDLTAKKPKKKVKKDKSNGDAKDKAASDSDAADDDGYESDMGGDAVDGFFKKLYAGSDPDTRRAMMKSYYESNGTALSTNWSEVGSKKVEEVQGKDD